MVLSYSRREALRPRQVGIDLDDEQPVRILAGTQQLGTRRADVQRQAEVAVLVRRCGLRHHDARREPGEDRRKLTEAAGNELDVVSHRMQQALGRPEEAAAIVHAGLGEDVVKIEAQRAADL